MNNNNNNKNNLALLRVIQSRVTIVESTFTNNKIYGSLIDIQNNLDIVYIQRNKFTFNEIISGNLVEINTSCVFINNTIFSTLSDSTLNFTLNTSNS